MATPASLLVQRVALTPSGGLAPKPKAPGAAGGKTTTRVTRGGSVVCAGIKIDQVQGGLSKKRCDLCLGTGKQKCYNCHVGEGWRAQNFSTSKCERPAGGHPRLFAASDWSAGS